MNNQSQPPLTPQVVKSKKTKTVLIIALLSILILVAAWHIFFPMLGVVVAVGAGAWSILVGTVVFLSVAVLLFFLLTGVGILILSIFSFIWVVFAITLFPFLFPLFLPLLVIVLFIAYVRRRS